MKTTLTSNIAKQAENQGGFPADAFEQLYALESASFWFQARNQLILWAILQHFPSMQSFLEIGCGTGYVLNAVSTTFPQAQITGADLFPKALEFAARRSPNAHFASFDATEIPFQSAFDVVGMFDVLEHIPQDVTVLRQIHKALKARGGLIITVPQHPNLWSQADDFAKHVRRYTRRELGTKLENAGFEILRCTSFVSLLLPAMVAFRTLQKSKDYVPTDEMHTASRLNGILGNIMQLEQTLIRRGVDLPLGGSLLAICRAN
jgi:SAM-dependent methyltransferase